MQGSTTPSCGKSRSSEKAAQKPAAKVGSSDADAPGEFQALGPERRGHWRHYVKQENLTNAPYWSRYESTLNPEEIAALKASRESAERDLAMVMTANKNLFSGSQIAAHVSGRTSNELIARAIAACASLRIPFQCLVAVPIPWGCSKEVTLFRSMDLGLKRFSTIGELAAYLKGQDCGAQAVLTGGPPKRYAVARDIKQRGVTARVEGAYGNRLVTLVAKTNARIDALHDWTKSGRDPNEFTYSIGNRHILLREGGPAVYMEGGHRTLIRQIRKYFGPASCSVKRTPDKRGWMVTLKKITKNRE